MVEQVAELVVTEPPDPDPVEKQVLAPEDSSNWRMPEENVLWGLVMAALNPPRV
jgi:hypothetical protein